MSDKSTIEWTDATWNPIRGCTKISPGCKHCYAETFAERFRGVEGHPFEKGFDLRLVPEKIDAPFHWKKPRRIFVNSMSDFFHEGVPVEYTIRLANVMLEANWHTYQILTKRSERMRDLLNSKLSFAAQAPHIWWGVSAENRKYGVPRIAHLQAANVAVRFVSAEPLLEDLGRVNLRGINWMIVGGESGHGARPFHLDWARKLIRECQDQNIACFVKQVGRQPWDGGQCLKLDSAKGGDPGEWPIDIRFREFPPFAPANPVTRNPKGDGLRLTENPRGVPNNDSSDTTTLHIIGQGDGLRPAEDGERSHRLLSNVEAYLRSYVRFPDDRYFLPLSLFSILEHCGTHECFGVAPYLMITALTKGAGKTLLLQLLQFLGGDEKTILLAGDVTVAALYTKIDEKTAVLIDESERLYNPNSPFRAILNGGYRRGATLARKIGGEVIEFSIFGPKAFSLIGDITDTTRDRCIIVDCQRTSDLGNIKEFVHFTAKEEGNEIAREIESVLQTRMEDIADSYLNYHELHSRLEFLRPRDREIWKPLFAVCQVLAPERIRELERSAIDIATLKTRPARRASFLKDEEERVQKMEYADILLKDTLSVIDGNDRITTADLIKKLRELHTAPWRWYEGTGIDEFSLSSLLRLHNVRPRTIRIKTKGEPGSTAKGYVRADLVAASVSTCAHESPMKA